MTRTGDSARPTGSADVAVAGRGDARLTARIGTRVVDLDLPVRWVGRHRVLTAGLVMLAAQLVWRAVFVGHEFFRQDDFYNLDLAIRSSFSWRYLTFVGPGHLMIGARMIVWVLVRTSPYNWALAATVIVALQGCAGLAAFRLLWTLFGGRRAILIPLAIYLLCPLALPALGFWSAAMESVPLQLAIFMALHSHVTYIRTGRVRQLAAACGWVIFGMLFFEKALILPPLLFAVTSAFGSAGSSWLTGARDALFRYWRAWTLYAVFIAGYAVLLATSLRTAASAVGVPSSFGAMVTFAFLLVKETFLPGALGGPWLWQPPGGSYALAAPPDGLAWLAVIVAVVVVGSSVARRKIAWRSWAILAGWIAAADVAPVIFGRARFLSMAAFWHETRYVADAVPVLAICVGLAFWPPRGRDESVPARDRGNGKLDQIRRAAIPALIGVFAAGSIWSALAYEIGTAAGAATTAEYIGDARQALRLMPDDTPVVDQLVPGHVMSPIFGVSAAQSAVIGAMADGQLAGKVRWITRPEGTIDQLMTFGSDGRLWLARVYGAASPSLPAGQGCWPERHGRIAVGLTGFAPSATVLLRIGYLWRASYPSFVTVRYGGAVQSLNVLPGLHSGYLPVTGRSATVVVSGLSGVGLCVGDVEAGLLGPIRFGPSIPRSPA